MLMVLRNGSIISVTPLTQAAAKRKRLERVMELSDAFDGKSKGKQRTIEEDHRSRPHNCKQDDAVKRS